MFGFKPRQFTDSSLFPRIPSVEPLEQRQLLSATIHHATATVEHAATKVVHAAKTHTKTAKAAKTTKASKKSKKNALASTNASATSTTSTGTTSTSGTGTTGTLGLGGGGNGGYLGGLPNIPYTGPVQQTITFSEAPTLVTSGLDSLASTDGLAAPTSSQTVYLGNSNGIETYSLHYTGTGTTSTITVDQNGNPVSKPTYTTTTFASLSASDSAAATELSAIATALNRTAPTDTTTVDVTTTSSGTVTYSIHLSYDGGTAVPVAGTNSSVGSIIAGVASAIGGLFGGGEIAVDAAGNPVGNEQLPFDVLPASIQSAINNNVPSGASTLATSSTQSVSVQTVDGLTLYSTTFDSTGTETRITVNAGGTLVSLPSTSTTTFAAIPTAAQSELQTLATADGVTTTISSTQSVTVYSEANGTVVYSVSLSTSNSTGTSSTTSTSSWGNFSDTITIAVDANGNPTVPPTGGIGGIGHGPIPIAFSGPPGGGGA